MPCLSRLALIRASWRLLLNIKKHSTLQKRTRLLPVKHTCKRSSRIDKDICTLDLLFNHPFLLFYYINFGNGRAYCQAYLARLMPRLANKYRPILTKRISNKRSSLLWPANTDYKRSFDIFTPVTK